MVDEAALLLVVRVMTPVGSMVACRLLAASALLSWFSVDTWPAPVPKVMLVAVPPPVAPISSVLPVRADEAAGRRLGDAAGEAERRQRRRSCCSAMLSVPLGGAGVQRDDAAADRGGRAGVAAGGVDRRQQVGDGAAGRDLVGAGRCR